MLHRQGSRRGGAWGICWTVGTTVQRTCNCNKSIISEFELCQFHGSDSSLGQPRTVRALHVNTEARSSTCVGPFPAWLARQAGRAQPRGSINGCAVLPRPGCLAARWPWLWLWLPAPWVGWGGRRAPRGHSLLRAPALARPAQSTLTRGRSPPSRAQAACHRGHPQRGVRTASARPG